MVSLCGLIGDTTWFDHVNGGLVWFDIMCGATDFKRLNVSNIILESHVCDHYSGGIKNEKRS